MTTSECRERPARTTTGRPPGLRAPIAVILGTTVLVPATLPPVSTAVVLGLAMTALVVSGALTAVLTPAADPVAVSVRGAALALSVIGLPLVAAFVLGPVSVPLLGAAVAAVTLWLADPGARELVRGRGRWPGRSGATPRWRR